MQDTLAGYERLLAGLKREEDYLQAANAAAARKRELAADLKKKTKEKEDMAGRLDQIRESLKGLEELAARLQEGLEAVKDAKESPLTEGGWQELLTQYQELIRAQSEDLKRLNDEKNRLIKEREKRRRLGAHPGKWTHWHNSQSSLRHSAAFLLSKKRLPRSR